MCGVLNIKDCPRSGGTPTNAITKELAELKAEIAAAVEALGANPTTQEIDNIYALFSSEAPADKWDGKTLTFTNIQQDGTERALYINSSNVLDISTAAADEIGTAA